MRITDHLAKVRQHLWRELLNIRKLVKFESEQRYSSQNREILLTFIWWEGRKFMFPNLNTSAEHFATLPSYIVVLFQQITLKPGNYGSFGPLSSGVNRLSLTVVSVKSWKKRWKDLFSRTMYFKNWTAVGIIMRKLRDWVTSLYETTMAMITSRSTIFYKKSMKVYTKKGYNVGVESAGKKRLLISTHHSPPAPTLTPT